MQCMDMTVLNCAFYLLGLVYSVHVNVIQESHAGVKNCQACILLTLFLAGLFRRKSQAIVIAGSSQLGKINDYLP